MVAEIARNAETANLPISGIGGITTWRDAAEFIALGAGSVQVCIDIPIRTEQPGCCDSDDPRGIPNSCPEEKSN